MRLLIATLIAQLLLVTSAIAHEWPNKIIATGTSEGQPFQVRELMDLDARLSREPVVNSFARASEAHGIWSRTRCQRQL